MGKKWPGGRCDISFSSPLLARAGERSGVPISSGLVIKLIKVGGEGAGWKENGLINGYSAALWFSTQSRGKGGG